VRKLVGVSGGAREGVYLGAEKAESEPRTNFSRSRAHGRGGDLISGERPAEVGGELVGGEGECLRG
jgi:hypothetical protein